MIVPHVEPEINCDWCRREYHSKVCAAAGPNGSSPAAAAGRSTGQQQEGRQARPPAAAGGPAASSSRQQRAAAAAEAGGPSREERNRCEQLVAVANGCRVQLSAAMTPGRPPSVAQCGKAVHAKRAIQPLVDSRKCTLGRAVRSVFHAVDAHVVVGFTPQSTFSRSQLVRTSDGYQRRALISSLDIFGYQVRQPPRGMRRLDDVNDVK